MENWGNDKTIQLQVGKTTIAILQRFVNWRDGWFREMLLRFINKLIEKKSWYTIRFGKRLQQSFDCLSTPPCQTFLSFCECWHFFPFCKLCSSFRALRKFYFRKFIKSKNIVLFCWHVAFCRLISNCLSKHLIVKVSKKQQPENWNQSVTVNIEPTPFNFSVSDEEWWTDQPKRRQRWRKFEFHTQKPPKRFRFSTTIFDTLST